ncbi:glycerophosphodiester phosphodiesterase [Cellulomonas soli]|uniref:Putative glycerophosphoryl diester phosphodiesterase YhdW n=1 Tax=Cellulomonas soli TaxID=931535 RepID=A0A512PCX2_9CELL|nr:glycerophosphodiester phosphodiesterase family protein [Cellulomonas soli]NYI58632.1 glycerophosphoryl diester phosphodiesterase [Cellulomonas soli]GEP69057.1 putative glycerophosphoryl diester phosphodiesterase YhdW [Cellulomonas soli]
MTVVIAHRGNSAVAPQNTLAAFEAAWRAGADMFELDVQLTADGAVVVIHDDDVDATTDGNGLVSEHTLAQIRELDAGSWFSPGFAGARVPTFEDVVRLLLTRPGIALLCEVKGEWTVDQVRLVTDRVLAAGLEDRVVVQSFWPGTVAALREAAPTLQRGLLVADAPDDLVARCLELGVAMCNPHGVLLLQHPDLLGRLHDAGLKVMVWTLDEDVHWAAAVAAGVDGIITDRPDRLAGWLAGRRSDQAEHGTLA